MLKKPLNKLNWKEGNIFETVENLKLKLRECPKLVDANPHDELLKSEEAEVLELYNEAISDEEKLLFQQAKINWISKGDKNSRYFHQVIKSRKHYNRVVSI